MLGQRRGHLPLRSARPKTKPCCRPRVAAFATFLAALWLLVMFNLRRLDAMKAAVRAPPAPSSLSHTAPPADDAPHYVLATFVNGYTVFQIVISATYGVNDLRNDLQIMYRKAGVKGEGISFLFTDSQITDERFLVFMNDLLSSGNIPGLFPAEDMDDIINNMRPAVKRAGLPDTRDNCWDMFINAVRDNLHVILCFSPIGDPIKIRTRRFPAVQPSPALLCVVGQVEL